MKKRLIYFAFTLGEVLITLTIIGIVAAMTIPTLMTNVRDRENVVKLKKAQSIIANAARMAVAQNGDFNITEHTEITDGKNLLDQLKIAINCKDYNDPNCPVVNGGLGNSGEFSMYSYIVSPDGIIYGYHPNAAMINIIEENGQEYTAMPFVVDFSGYDKGKLNQGNRIAYGFYVKPDGTVFPAGYPNNIKSKSELKSMICPQSRDNFKNPNPYCTFWTLQSGKFRKNPGEWFE